MGTEFDSTFDRTEGVESAGPGRSSGIGGTLGQQQCGVAWIMLSCDVSKVLAVDLQLHRKRTKRNPKRRPRNSRLDLGGQLPDIAFDLRT
jgi:hypothetical protein